MIFHILLALSLQASALSDTPTAVVNIQRLVAESTLGKAATAQLRAFQTQKQKIIADKQAEVQQLNRSGAVRTRIEKAQLELQRLTQDAETELAALDRQLQEEFSKKLRPVIAQIAIEEHIGIILELPQQMILWVSPSADVTAKVIERLEAETKEKK
jgi:Skp family chaperone for outer membrane proteins